MCATPLAHSGFKPTCCDKSLCLFKYNELGLGLSVLHEIKAQPAVADLVITFAFCASNGDRIHWYFPSSAVQATVVDPETGKINSTLSFVDKDDKKNIILFKEVLALMPSVDELCACATDQELKAKLDALHKLLHPLLQWLIASNRSHLRPLTESERCPGGPIGQFVLLTSDPSREKFFRDERQRIETKRGVGNGSVLLTHGSGAGNWHIILRTGLKTSKNVDELSDAKEGLKNTGGISEGGAIGASGGAIWMSMQPSVSMGYTKPGVGWGKSRFGSNVYCMAICEVVLDDSKRVTTRVAGGSHVEGKHEYVCNDVRIIAPRVFWIWPQARPPNLAGIGQWDGSSCTGPGTVDFLLGENAKNLGL